MAEPRSYTGSTSGIGLRIFVACSRFNEFVTTQLLGGATDALAHHRVADDEIDVAWVPGAFELPLIASKAAKAGTYDAVIALGAVVRGETGHYDVVAAQCAAGIAQVSLETGVPVIFGVLTTDTFEQALARAGGSAGNKGYDAAIAAIEMANLIRGLAIAPK